MKKKIEREGEMKKKKGEERIKEEIERGKMKKREKEAK